MSEQLTLDGSTVTVEAAQRVKKGNPLIPIYGSGPGGMICGDCSHLYAQGGTAGTYYKCELRRNTRGPGTDHRYRWPACGRFEVGS